MHGFPRAFVLVRVCSCYGMSWISSFLWGYPSPRTINEALYSMFRHVSHHLTACPHSLTYILLISMYSKAGIGFAAKKEFSMFSSLYTLLSMIHDHFLDHYLFFGTSDNPIL